MGFAARLLNLSSLGRPRPQRQFPQLKLQTPPEPATATLLPPHSTPLPSIEDAHPEPSAAYILPMPEIQLHIAINVVSSLNAVEEARLLWVEEQSLCEFLMDQILFLHEILEPWLVPHIIKDLHSREMVASPLLDKDILSPQPPVVGGKEAEVQSVVVCTSRSLSVGASVVVVHEPTEELVLLSPSPELVTRSPSTQVVMTQCNSYVECHEKVVKSFKAKPPELAALELGPEGGAQVCSRRNARLTAKCRGGTINPKYWFLVVTSLARRF
jgi:hypothetical protein